MVKLWYMQHDSAANRLKIFLPIYCSSSDKPRVHSPFINPSSFSLYKCCLCFSYFSSGSTKFCWISFFSSFDSLLHIYYLLHFWQVPFNSPTEEEPVTKRLLKWLSMCSLREGKITSWLLIGSLCWMTRTDP